MEIWFLVVTEIKEQYLLLLHYMLHDYIVHISTLAGA